MSFSWKNNHEWRCCLTESLVSKPYRPSASCPTIVRKGCLYPPDTRKPQLLLYRGTSEAQVAVQKSVIEMLNLMKLNTDKLKPATDETGNEVCAICMCPPDEPVTFSCSHHYCTECFTTAAFHAVSRTRIHLCAAEKALARRP